MKRQSVVAPKVFSPLRAKFSDRRNTGELQAERAESAFQRGPGLAKANRPYEVTGPEGSPLPERSRREMSHRLGHDFGKVRVYADRSAASAARLLGAHAFTAGETVVFGEEMYSPQTRFGQALLAHELTHVAQQRTLLEPTIMAKGRTARGFFANLFRFWDYSQETLNEYLATLNRTSEIEGDYDSDDMARQIAAEWKADRSAYDLSPRLRVLLIREMLDGVVFGSDQEGILTLLENSSNAELKQMIGTAPDQITYAEIYEEFGVERARLELFHRSVLQQLSEIKEPPPGGKPLLEMLEEKEVETGLRVNQVSVSFQLAPGKLYKSFLYNVVVPKNGVIVTVRITREDLRIGFSPGIIFDVIGPVNPTLFAVKFRFQGTEFDVSTDQFSETANRKVHAFIREMLAGTRFAAPDYNFSRDPNLFAEISDPLVIGDLNRVRYNFEKASAGERESAKDAKKDEKLQQRALGMVSGAGATIAFVHPNGDRYPQGDEGWGIRIPPGTQFTLGIETRATGAEVAQKEAELSRLKVRSSGILVVRGTEDILQIGGFDMLPGLEFKLYGLRELKRLTEVVREEYPGKLSNAVTGAIDVVDTFFDVLDALSGKKRESSLALRLAKWLGEREMNAKGMYFVRLYWSTIRDFTGMNDAQISKFFGVKPPLRR